MSNNGRRKSRNIKNVHVMFNHVTAHTNVLNLKKMVQFFLSCNPFPSWPSKAKDIDNYSRGIVVGKVVLNRTEALFQGFLSFLPMCVRFKISTLVGLQSHIEDGWCLVS